MAYTYWDVVHVADDADLQARCMAAAALETIPEPQTWAYARRWQYAAQPGWGDAYASAVVAGNPNPGRDPAVITDPMILSATQALAAAG